jgi:hypothetical protein
MIGILTWPVYRGKKHGIQIGKHLAKGSKRKLPFVNLGAKLLNHNRKNNQKNIEINFK